VLHLNSLDVTYSRLYPAESNGKGCPCMAQKPKLRQSVRKLGSRVRV
jgi:hypothetical protein